MKVALAQVDCVLGEVDANLARATEVVAEARGQGADLVVFPELNLTGYSLGSLSEDVSMSADDPRLLELAAAAEDTAVVLGFQEATRGLRSYNSAAWLERGVSLHVHRKLYPATYNRWEERKHFSPGQSLRAFDSRLGRMAVLICNDVWQPPAPFLAVQDGAEMIVVPANSARSDDPTVLHTEGYWSEINRFYARMLQCYVVFVNRVGEEEKLSFWGGSSIIDPWGEAVATAPLDEEAVVVVDVDLSAVRRRRQELPLVREARLGMLSRQLDRLGAEEDSDM